MKTILGFNLRSFLLATPFMAGLAGGTHASAQTYRSYLIDLDSRTATDLVNLGGDYSYASAINGAGQVAGYSYTADDSQHAFITGPKGVGMRDLNSLVYLPIGWFLTAAADMNNSAGHCLRRICPDPSIPEPESYALLLAGLAFIAVVARRRKRIGALPTGAR